ncbi:unnamed protein product [Closterium sp. NIES-53]
MRTRYMDVGLNTPHAAATPRDHSPDAPSPPSPPSSPPPPAPPSPFAPARACSPLRAASTTRSPAWGGGRPSTQSTAPENTSGAGLADANRAARPRFRITRAGAGGEGRRGVKVREIRAEGEWGGVGAEGSGEMQGERISLHGVDANERKPVNLIPPHGANPPLVSVKPKTPHLKPADPLSNPHVSPFHLTFFHCCRNLVNDVSLAAPPAPPLPALPPPAIRMLSRLSPYFLSPHLPISLCSTFKAPCMPAVPLRTIIPRAFSTDSFPITVPHLRLSFPPVFPPLHSPPAARATVHSPPAAAFPPSLAARSSPSAGPILAAPASAAGCIFPGLPAFSASLAPLANSASPFRVRCRPPLSFPRPSAKGTLFGENLLTSQEHVGTTREPRAQDSRMRSGHVKGINWCNSANSFKDDLEQRVWRRGRGEDVERPQASV